MDDLTFVVYLPTRGNAVSLDNDGELTLRLSVPRTDEDGVFQRDAVLLLVDRLGRGDGQSVRLVAVRP